MYAEITAGIASIKTASDLVALILKAKIDAAVKEKVIELQSSIIALHSQMMTIQTEYKTLLAENDRLKEELVKVENWEVERADYELTEIGPGSFAYVAKSDKATGRDKPWLCTNCFDNRKQKCILYQDGPAFLRLYSCSGCNTHMTIQ